MTVAPHPPAPGIIDPPRKVMEDRSLPHQIRLIFTGPGRNLIGVSCTCLNGQLLAARRQGDTAADLAVWREHVRKKKEETA